MRRMAVLVLCLCLLLTACGKNNSQPTVYYGSGAGGGNTTQSKDAQEVSAMIGALGEITLESIDAIREAESAYEALSQTQKKKVENYDTLVAARNSYYSLVIVGQWCRCLNAESLGYVSYGPSCVSEFAADGTCVINVPNWGATLEGTWTLADGKLITTYDEDGWDDTWTVTEKDGTVCIYREDYYEGEDIYYYPVSVYQEKMEEIFVTVDIAQEGLEDYLGFYTYEYEPYDIWDEPTGEKYEKATYAVKKQDGLYYWGVSDNLLFEVTIPEHTYYYDYYDDGEGSYVNQEETRTDSSFFDSWGFSLTMRYTGPEGSFRIDLELDDITFGRARGKLVYIKEEYIKEVRIEEDQRVLVVELDGKTHEYWTPYYGYDY